jgi:hypothetical protein
MTIKGIAKMKRDEWLFTYTAKDLAVAAKAQKEFREGRVAAWEAKKTETMARIKESGLTVHEDLAVGMSAANMLNKYQSTHAIGGPQILIDDTMQRDLNECHMKLNEHRNLVKQYSAWLQVLEANPADRVSLDHDDWMFFFGK